MSNMEHVINKHNISYSVTRTSRTDSLFDFYNYKIYIPKKDSKYLSLESMNSNISSALFSIFSDFYNLEICNLSYKIYRFKYPFTSDDWFYGSLIQRKQFRRFFGKEIYTDFMRVIDPTYLKLENIKTVGDGETFTNIIFDDYIRITPLRG